jgi:hypothetical protein
MRILVVPQKPLSYVIGVTSPCLDESRVVAFVAGELSVALRDSVEAHIDDCDSCRQVLAAQVRHAAGSAPTAHADRVVPVDGWPDRTRIGRYVVLGKLGRGGMGSVYRAEDTELARPVALKRLHAAADSDTRARLVREARAAAQLAHPNVLTVYEVGDHEGTPYIAMELVDGSTLTAWLGHDRTWREIVAMFVQAGRGLVAAHERGLVHRDFKPDNVLVDRAGRARVADFGLARLWDGDTRDLRVAKTHDVGLARMTATGALSGTPAYMAPEIVDGAAPNAASDQFAFAVALHEALRAQHPFAGSTPGALWAEMAAGRVRDGGRKVPAWLDRVVRRGLAADPALRWPNIASILEALERPQRRTWPYLASAGVVTLASLVVAVVALKSTRETPAEIAPQQPKAVAAQPPVAQPPLAQPPVAQPPLAQPPPAAASAEPTKPDVPAKAAAKTDKGKKRSPAELKAILEDAGYDGMNGQYASALQKARGVLADDPTNQWAMQVVVYSSCALRFDLVQDKGDAGQITKYEALARITNQTLDATHRGSIHSECDRLGIWLEGDVEDVGSHKKWHADAKPPPKTPPPARIALNNIALHYTEDPAGALSQIEDVLAKDPENAQGLRLATVVACDIRYELKQHGGGAADLAASEQKARDYAAKLTPHDRWLVASECDRWGGIKLEGDIDKKGDGVLIEHIGPLAK